MKSVRFLQHPLRWFILAQVGVALLVIYRENRFIAQLYEMQKWEQCSTLLAVDCKKLTNELHKIQSIGATRAYAAAHPQLKPIKLSRVHTL